MDKKNIDENLYNEKSLYLLNIRELRDIGRKFNVPSPTTLKKHELVDYILKVVYGEIEPPLKRSCGRPNIREFDMNKYIDKIKKNIGIAEQLKEARLEYNFDDIPDFSLKLSSQKDFSHLGEIEQRVVFIDDSGCYLRERQFIASNNDILISDKLTKQLRLENFDVVEFIKANENIKIISVNGIKIANKIKPFKVDNLNITAGTRKVFHIRTKEEINEEIKKIKKVCQEQNLKLVSLGNEKYFELGDDSFVFDKTGDNNYRYKQLMIFVEYCKKLVYENQDVLVIIQEMTEIEHIINLLEYEVKKRVEKYLNDEINAFVKLGNIILTFHELQSLTYSSERFQL